MSSAAGGRSLEQVLARSLKTPRRRVPNFAVPSDATAAAAASASGGDASAASAPSSHGGGGVVLPTQAIPGFSKLPKKEVASLSCTKGGAQASHTSGSGTGPHGWSSSAETTSNLQDLTSVLFAARRMGDWNTALATFQKHATPQPPPQPHTLNDPQMTSIISTLLNAGRIDVLKQCFVDALTGQEKQEEKLVTESAVVKVVEAIGRKGGYDEVTTFVSSLPASACSVEVCNAVVQSCEIAGEWDKALSFYASSFDHESIPEAPPMDEATESDRGGGVAGKKPRPNAVTYAALMAVLEETHRVDESNELMQKMPLDCKAAIMSSYAALIHVWSARHGTKGVKKF